MFKKRFGEAQSSCEASALPCSPASSGPTRSSSSGSSSSSSSPIQSDIFVTPQVRCSPGRPALAQLPLQLPPLLPRLLHRALPPVLTRDRSHPATSPTQSSSSRSQQGSRAGQPDELCEQLWGARRGSRRCGGDSSWSASSYCQHKPASPCHQVGQQW